MHCTQERCWQLLLAILCLIPALSLAQGFGFNERGPSLEDEIRREEQANPPPPPPPPREAGSRPSPAPQVRGFFRKETYGAEEDIYAEGIFLPE